MGKRTSKILTILLSIVTFMGVMSFSTSQNVELSLRAEESKAETLEETSIQQIDFNAEYEQNEYLDIYGRTYYDAEADGIVLWNSASGFEVRFVGTKLTVNWYSGIAKIESRGCSWFSIFVDGATDSNAHVVKVDSTTQYVDQMVISGLSEGEHTVRVLKRTASNAGECYVSSIKTDGEFKKVEQDTRLKIEVYGDSITVGSGILRNVYWSESSNKYIDDGNYNNEVQNVFQSYIGYAAQNLNARLNVYGRGGIAMKYGGTGAKNIMDNYNAIHVDADPEELPYDYASYTPDVIVIGLGTNDYNLGRTRGVYSVEGLKAGFEQFIREVIGRNYGKDIPIFLCVGQMVPTARLPEHMEDIASRLIEEFPNIEAVGFDACYAGHPIAEEGEVAGKKLSDAITAKLNALK